jgi:3-oxoacyl-[acyl-carrier protein] reductase
VGNTYEGQSYCHNRWFQGTGQGNRREICTVGARSVIIARNRNDLKKTTDELKTRGIKVFPYVCDVSSEDMVKSTVSSIIKDHGRIDYLVNNAGTGHLKKIEDVTTEDYEQTMNTNMKGTFLMTKYILPHMKTRKAGFIINVSSGQGLHGTADLSIYGASKFAVRGFSEALSLEAKPYNIRVAVLYPGSINTVIHRLLGKDYTQEELSRMMQPSDVAENDFPCGKPTRTVLDI